MNSKLKVLCAFTIFLFVGSMAVSGVNAYISIAYANAEQAVPAVTYGDDRRNEAVSILIYTEYTDLIVDQEWDRTMDSMIGSLEGKFTYDNLTDYTQLSSVISEYDILLLPENEKGNFTTSNMIAAVWSSILPSFVENGGIVICMEYGPSAALRGTTAQILNATGLMEIYNPVSALGHQLNLVDSNDALARNMPASYVAVSGSTNFDTTDGVVVMEDDTNGKAVVVHKTIGAGHVVLLGFDMYTVNANQDTLLMNAILLHRHVIFDNSHSQYVDITSGLNTIANDLPYYGFSVSSMEVFDSAIIDSCEILVISYCATNYSASEIAIIQDFVNGGGALLLITEYTFFGDSTDDLMNAFGYARNTTSESLEDSDDYNINPWWISFGPDNIQMHSAKVGVDVLEVYASAAIIEMPDGAVPLVITDIDGTSTWDGTDEANGLPVAVAQTVGDGRISIFGDNGFVSDYDPDSDGDICYLDEDNEIFTRNVFRWLAGAGIPEQTVVFDYSNNPVEYLHSGWNPLANFLMFNGYNTIFTIDFDPSVYNSADILVICDGALDYNTTEIAFMTNYVQNGGALLLWGDNTIYGEQVDPIGQEFGLVINTTGYLDDTDDFDTYASYIIYEGSNFATHPIMQGVNRIEVDRSAGMISVGSGTALISTDNDATAIWIDGSPAPNVPVFGATTYSKGRVVFLTDVNMGDLSDPEGDGFGDLYDSDNSIFVANVFKWLAENRAPTVEVITPNGGEVLNGTRTIEWNADDFDNDPLSFDVFYSDNNGSDWTLLVNDLVLPEFAWNTTLHDDGSGYMIRVVASDGLATGSDESDDPFELDNFVGGGPGIPLDLTLLLIIGAGVIVVVIIIVIIMKKKK